MGPRPLGRGLPLLALLGCLIPGARAASAERPFFVELLERGEGVVLAWEQGPIRLLSVPDLQAVREFRGTRSGTLEGVAVAGNGRWLAVGYRDEGLEVRELATGEVRFTIPLASRVGERRYLFHPRDDRLFIFRQGRLEQWDASRGELTGTLRGILGVERMSVSPDGRYLAVAGWCRTGCGDFGLCVYGLEERLVLAGSLEVFDSDSKTEIVDLAYAEDHSLILSAGDWATRLAAGTLRPGAAPREPRSYRAIRSAPGPRHRHETLDGEWKVSVSEEGTRLYLYRREPGDDPGRGFDLEKLVRLR